MENIIIILGLSLSFLTGADVKEEGEYERMTALTSTIKSDNEEIISRLQEKTPALGRSDRNIRIHYPQS